MADPDPDDEAWEQVRHTVAARATRDWIDDLDWYSLGQLTTHRDDAIALLEHELSVADDHRCATGLKVLGSQGSHRVLVEAMNRVNASDATRLAAADAVDELFADPAGFEVVCDLLVHGRTGQARGQAAGWLGQRHTRAAEDALLGGCADRDPAVRQQSSQSLLAMTGLEQRAEPRSRVSLLSVRLGLGIASAAAVALDDLCELIELQRAGEDLSAWLESPPDTAAWTEMRVALTAGTATPAMWDALSPVERDRISYVLHFKLEQGDASAEDDLASLGVAVER